MIKMPKEEKFESDKQRKWYNATDQDFWDENKSVDDAIDDLEEIVEEHDLEEDEWESVDDASDYLFEHKVKKFCGIPERERDPNHPQPIPAMANEPEPERPEDIDRRKPKPPIEKWWDTIKEAGPVTTTAPGVNPGLVNVAYGQGQQPPPEEEEEEYEIIPEEPDFWRD
jgi:hypothetical protein